MKGARIQEELNGRGMRQSDLVRLLNDRRTAAGRPPISKSTVSRVLGGHLRLTDDFVREVADALDAPKLKTEYLDAVASGMFERPAA